LIQPLADRLLVRRLDQPPCRIMLTDREPYRVFRVVAVGPQVTEVSPGELVVLPGVASTEPDHEIPEGQFIREADIGWKLRGR
jgi:hypothetical protein